MSGGLTFAEFIGSMRPMALLIFYNDCAQVLTAADQVDQAVVLKGVFSGRWPHMG